LPLPVTSPARAGPALRAASAAAQHPAANHDFVRRMCLSPFGSAPLRRQAAGPRPYYGGHSRSTRQMARSWLAKYDPSVEPLSPEVVPGGAPRRDPPPGRAGASTCGTRPLAPRYEPLQTTSAAVIKRRGWVNPRATFRPPAVFKTARNRPFPGIFRTERQNGRGRRRGGRSPRRTSRGGGGRSGRAAVVIEEWPRNSWTAFTLTSAAIISEAAVCRASWSVVASSPAFFQAARARS
jgi:uncharacterized membrane protein YgcG